MGKHSTAQGNNRKMAGSGGDISATSSMFRHLEVMAVTTASMFT